MVVVVADKNGNGGCLDDRGRVGQIKGKIKENVLPLLLNKHTKQVGFFGSNSKNFFFRSTFYFELIFSFFPPLLSLLWCLYGLRRRRRRHRSWCFLCIGHKCTLFYIDRRRRRRRHFFLVWLLLLLLYIPSAAINNFS